MKKIFLFILLDIIFLVQVKSQLPDNLIPNANFESGNTPFECPDNWNNYDYNNNISWWQIAEGSPCIFSYPCNNHIAVTWVRQNFSLYCNGQVAPPFASPYPNKYSYIWGTSDQDGIRTGLLNPLKMGKRLFYTIKNECKFMGRWTCL